MTPDERAREVTAAQRARGYCQIDGDEVPESIMAQAIRAAENAAFEKAAAIATNVKSFYADPDAAQLFAPMGESAAEAICGSIGGSVEAIEEAILALRHPQP